MIHLASLVTMGRIIGALILLLTEPLSSLFFVVYFLCCMSDLLDGYIARKTNTTSSHGEILDSVADFIFAAVLLFILIPLFEWENWMPYWIAIIALTRLVSLSVGFVKYHTFSLLHTHTNKITGIALVTFPVFHQLFGFYLTALILCAIASLSALEELIITILAKKLNRNIPHIFAVAE
ncbi:MAG: CDP-alcohol phosphatidyltransferase family protein [Defluviitaleaceae bacterium]|nr:CDP-alcohol phosphatidyltransferase family protein [Defluviitaleaceae bacterium]MCL2263064.1 CDP-alcohol phosphatidyltransferase family protein [Defluviitaleaceae bacterium]